MSEISKQALKVDNSQSFPDNNAGAITPSDLRAFNTNMIDSLVDEITFNAFSSSVTSSIEQLSAFTASQQPAFNALNAFTASQLTINTGYNAATHSLNASVTSLNSEVLGIQIWTASVNEISFNSGIPNYATRWNFGGFISASFVENVGGRIADITILQDPTKLNTSSFNDYTASTAATQSIFSASVATSISQSSATFTAFSQSQNSFNQSATASLVELLSLSSSLSGGYATQGELDAVSSSLNTTINNVSSSLNTTINNVSASQSLLNVTFATTGSNSFNGNQEITGSLTVSGNTFITPASVSTSAKYRLLFVSGSTISTDNEDALSYNPATNNLFVSSSSGQSTVTPLVINYTSVTSSITSTLAKGAITSTDATGAPTTFKSIAISANPSVTGNPTTLSITNPSILTPSSSIGGFIAPIQFQDRSGYTDGRVTVTTPLILNNSITITGSAYGNVVPLSISSETASMDLSLGNFFTLTLVSESVTHLTTTNVGNGQTINLLVSQPNDATGSLTYNSTIKFPAGNNYIATATSQSQDIISFITFNSSTIYATSINNLV